jgi:hydrogenase nickel incorporation protein HypA/HybF
MHEMALAEGMLEIVEDVARRNDATKVRTVWLELGALSHVDAHALRFCFEAVTKGGVANGATLEIVTVPGLAWCMPCGERVPLAQLGEPCPRCAGYQLQVVAGDDMKVREIAVA